MHISKDSKVFSHLKVFSLVKTGNSETMLPICMCSMSEILKPPLIRDHSLQFIVLGCVTSIHPHVFLEHALVTRTLCCEKSVTLTLKVSSKTTHKVRFSMSLYPLIASEYYAFVPIN